MDRQREAGTNRGNLSCGNLAHGFAASGEDKPVIRTGAAMNIGIVTAYNDMLSAHQPYGRYPEMIKIAAREVGATAQVAGGVPAMCDGVTQGQAGMDLRSVEHTSELQSLMRISSAVFCLTKKTYFHHNLLNSIHFFLYLSPSYIFNHHLFIFIFHYI